MIEMAIAVGVIAVIAIVAIPNIDFRKFEMDSNARNVQNHIIAAQTTAVQKNKNVVLTFVYCNNQFRTVIDANGNNGYDAGETRTWVNLSEGAKFVTPLTTIDGAGLYYATGPGIIVYNNVAATNGQVCVSSPSIVLYPRGSTSGDVVIYIGSAAGRKQDYRAIQVYGATGKVHIWRTQPDGSWKESDMQ